MRLDAIWRGETRNLDDAARRSAAGAFARLSAGRTHYELGTPDRPASVVLIHGFSVPYFIWDPTFKALRTAGINPLRYDLYGRGYSDRPQVKYGMDLFVDQLVELLDALGVQTADIAGLSMGGVIAATFVVRHPERVRKLILIGSSGMAALPQHLLYRIAAVPGLGELAFGLAGTGTMVQGIASDFFDPGHVAAFRDLYRAQMQFRGFKAAILSTIRSRMLGPFTAVYQELSSLMTPILLIWGMNDRTVPFEQSPRLLELIPRTIFHPIPDCGHIPHYEKPELINPILIDFLQA